MKIWTFQRFRNHTRAGKGIEYANGKYDENYNKGLFDGITCVVMSPGVPVEGDFIDEIKGIKLSERSNLLIRLDLEKFMP